MEEINKIWQIFMMAVLFSVGIKCLSPKEYATKYLVGLGVVIVCACLPWLVMDRECLFLLFPCAIFYLCLDKDMRSYNIIVLFSVYVITCLMDQILTTICVKELHIQLEQLQDMGNYYSAILCGVEVLLSVVGNYMIGKYLKKRIYPKMMSYPKKVLILIAAYITSMVFVFAFNILAEKKIGYSQTTLSFNLILFSIYFIVSFFLLIFIVRANAEASRTKLQLIQYENLKEYTNNIERMHMELRAFKHDYINIMTSMMGYLEEKNYDGLEVYFTEHIIPLNGKLRESSFNLNQLMNIKQPEIKGLLSAKLIYASEMGVDVTIEVLETIEKMNVNIIDISRILGIYLDNAIEASLETETPKIGVSIIKEKEFVIILITNSFINRNIIINQMFQKDFSSKGEARGIGLYNVSQILKAYPNIYRDTFVENNEFCQKLVIE